jgi:hypothetical protein
MLKNNGKEVFHILNFGMKFLKHVDHWAYYFLARLTLGCPLQSLREEEAHNRNFHISWC